MRVLVLVGVLLMMMPALAYGGGDHHNNETEVDVDVWSKSFTKLEASNNFRGQQFRNTPNLGGMFAADACSSQFQAAVPGAAAGASKGNPACMWQAQARTWSALGYPAKAFDSAMESEMHLRRQNNIIVKYLEMIPLIGKLF